MATPAVADVVDLDVTTYAPMVYLYPYAQCGDPVYNPCSVDWFLNGGTTGQGLLLGRPKGQDYSPAPGQAFDQQQLLTEPDPSNYVTIPFDKITTSSIRAGDLTSAVAYAHRWSPGPPGVTDFQYWLFYAIRGLSTARFMFETVLGHKLDVDIDMDLIAPPDQEYLGAGEHQGDFKHMTVRVDDQGRILGVFYAQHNGGFWCLPGSFDVYTGTSQPIGYSSRNTHSCFPIAGEFNQLNTLHEVDAVLIDFDVALLEHTANGGDMWNCATGCVDLDASPPTWLGFIGHWGPPINQTIAPDAFAPLVDSLTEDLPLTSHEKQEIEALIAQHASSFAGTEQGAATPNQQTPWSHGDHGAPNWTSGTPKNFDVGTLPNVSLRNDGLALQVHVSHESSSNLYYSMATLDALSLPITWPQHSESYDVGTTPAADLNDNGFAFEVHKSHQDGDYTLYYNLFAVNGTSLNRLETDHYDTGVCPDVAINNENYVLEVHQSHETHSGAYQVSYNLGTIGSNCRITWSVTRQQLQPGLQPSVAMNNDNNAIIMWQDDSADLYYAVYSVGEAGLSQIVGPTKYDVGAPAAVALNDNNVVLAAHQSHQPNDWNLYCNIGLLDLTSNKASIKFTTKNGMYYDVGMPPSVALNNSDMALELHQGHTSFDLYNQFSLI